MDWCKTCEGEGSSDVRAQGRFVQPSRVSGVVSVVVSGGHPSCSQKNSFMQNCVARAILQWSLQTRLLQFSTHPDIADDEGRALGKEKLIRF
jgi:hypothetical protein